MWRVRVEGRTITGHPPDAGASLLFLTFARDETPDAREREVLAVAGELDGLSDPELETLFRRARPYAPPSESEEIFPGTRRSRGRGR